MSLNWKEIALILKEADLTGSRIQSVMQNSFFSLTWELYNREKGRFYYYTEVGTLEARLHIIPTEKVPEKLKKLQRFIQFARHNIEGAIITKVEQMPFDRCVIWHLKRGDEELKIFIRLYSGSGANIIVTDSKNKILDLLLRRPNRDEISGKTLKLDYRTEDAGDFTVRPYSGDFNTFIATNYKTVQDEGLYQKLIAQVKQKKDKELNKIQNSVRSAETTIEKNINYNHNKELADILTSNKHTIIPNSEQIILNNWNTGEDVCIELDKNLTPGENIQMYYSLYEKQKNAYKNALEEKGRLEKLFSETESKYDKLLTPSDSIENDINRLKKFTQKEAENRKQSEQTKVGVRFKSGGFDIIAGRNAIENDELLRHYSSPLDTWVHTRDYPGGFVFIKFKKNKSIPLDVLLDAANISALFSKGKNDTNVSLYYTQVRFLRRAKNGKKGLVLPTQEKNLTIKPDPQRLKRLFNNKEQNE